MVFVHRVTVEPDAHRILGTKQLNVADTRCSADGILDVRSDVVGDIILSKAFIVRNKTGDQKEAAAGLLNANPLLLNFLRQQRHGQLQLVLHLHLGDVRVCSRLEGQGDGDITR